MNKFITINQAAKLMGVSPQTLRRWEKQGKGIPCHKTSGGQRRYNLNSLSIPNEPLKSPLITLAYARVSSHDQKEDLQRQEKMLEMFCFSRGWIFEILSDLGSGMNYQKKGLKKLIGKILTRQISRLVLTHKDRLLRACSKSMIRMLCCYKFTINPQKTFGILINIAKVFCGFIVNFSTLNHPIEQGFLIREI